jgi:hypothetical protein
MPQLATMLPTILKIAQPVMGLFGAGSSILEGYKQQQYQNKLRSLAQDPRKFMAYANGFKQPLAAGLLQGTENAAQGYAAERGLASSPALENQIVSQAIAPLLQQQQNQAVQDAWNALQLGGGAAPQNPMGGLQAGLASLSKLFPGQTPPAPDPNAGTNPPILGDIWANVPINLPDNQTLPSFPSTPPTVTQGDNTQFQFPYMPPDQGVDLTAFGFGGA